jgi:hypothetical protein
MTPCLARTRFLLAARNSSVLAPRRTTSQHKRGVIGVILLAAKAKSAIPAMNSRKDENFAANQDGAR